jgi:hypothetical protein
MGTFMIISRWILYRTIMFLTLFVEKIKTHILCPVTFSRKSCHVWDRLEKFRRASEATENIIRRRKMWFACRVIQATIYKNTQNVQYLLIFLCEYVCGKWLSVTYFACQPFATVQMRYKVFWGTAPRQWVLGVRSFGWGCVSHLQGSNVYYIT